MKRPSKSDCKYIAGLYEASEEAELKDAKYEVHLTADVLWLSRQVVIPLDQIRAKEVIFRKGLVKHYALRIVCGHPAGGPRTAVHLCDVTFLGLYRRGRLDELSSAIDIAIRELDLDSMPCSTASLENVETTSFLGSIHDALQGLTAPRETLEAEYMQRVQEIRNQGEIARATDDSIRDYLILRRFTGGWYLFWYVALPLAVSLTKATAPSAEHPLVSGFIGLGLGFFMSLVLGQVTLRPAIWLLKKFLRLTTVP